MDKETILNYVTETPGNTNRAVLGSMLDSMGGGESSSNVFVADVVAVATKMEGSDFTVYNCTSDVSYSDVVDAYNAGKAIIVRGTINPNDGRPEAFYDRKEYILARYTSMSPQDMMTFQSIYSATQTGVHDVFVVSEDGWTYTY